MQCELFSSKSNNIFKHLHYQNLKKISKWVNMIIISNYYEPFLLFLREVLQVCCPGQLQTEVDSLASVCIVMGSQRCVIRSGFGDNAVCLPRSHFIYSPGWPATSYIDQVGLELRGQPFSVSKVLGIKTCKNYAHGRRF